MPGIRLFRAPDMVMFLLVLAAATLAALGVDRLLEAAREDRDEGWRAPLRVAVWAAGAMAVLALVAASGALLSGWTSVIYPEAVQARVAQVQPFVARGALLSALLVAGVAGLAWALRRAWLAPAGLLAGLVFLVAVDALRVDGAFVQVLDFQAWSRPDPNVQAILDRQAGDPEPYRLLSFAQQGQDVSPAMHGIELAAGHHPNDLSRYRELIGMVGSGMPENLYDARIRRLLNVRYLLWPDLEMGGSIEGPVISSTQLRDGRPYQTLFAEDGLPRARLVGNAVVKSDAEAVSYMLSAAFDPETEVVLAEPPPLELDGDALSGEVRWEERTPNRLRLRVTSDGPALLVIADNWFPAWHASVDGEAAPVLRAYHTLRAVPVEAGEHVVELWYSSAVLTRSLWLSVVVLLALLAVTGRGLVRERRRPA